MNCMNNCNEENPVVSVSEWFKNQHFKNSNTDCLVQYDYD